MLRTVPYCDNFLIAMGFRGVAQYPRQGRPIRITTLDGSSFCMCRNLLSIASRFLYTGLFRSGLTALWLGGVEGKIAVVEQSQRRLIIAYFNLNIR